MVICCTWANRVVGRQKKRQVFLTFSLAAGKVTGKWGVLGEYSTNICKYSNYNAIQRVCSVVVQAIPMKMVQFNLDNQPQLDIISDNRIVTE
jgi:hypothetical protein